MTLPAATDDLGIEDLRHEPPRLLSVWQVFGRLPDGRCMDVLPNRLIRLVQLGQAEKAMRAESIWKCVSCMTCTARCPKSVDCAGVMDALRQIRLQNAAPCRRPRRRTLLFQKAFLDNIRRNGRLRELELVGAFKLRAFLARSQSAGLDEGFLLLAPKLTAGAASCTSAASA